MEENELYDRIGETDLNPTYKDGQVYQHIDVNNMVSITKKGINENYYDIQKLQNGEKSVGNAKKFDDATLSRSIDETLQADDNKVPSSQQVKSYIDGQFSSFTPPVRGKDYWTNEDKEEIVDETARYVTEDVTSDLYQTVDGLKQDMRDEMQQDLTDAEQQFSAYVSEYGEALENFPDDMADLKAKVNNSVIVANEAASDVEQLDTDLQVQKARIDNIASLDEGSTTGDAELQDIRVGANGITYNSAGGAVRGQYTELNSKIDALSFLEVIDGTVNISFYE